MRAYHSSPGAKEGTGGGVGRSEDAMEETARGLQELHPLRAPALLHVELTCVEFTHRELVHMEHPHVELVYMELRHTELTRVEKLTHKELVHLEHTHVELTYMELRRAELVRVEKHRAGSRGPAPA